MDRHRLGSEWIRAVTLASIGNCHRGEFKGRCVIGALEGRCVSLQETAISGILRRHWRIFFPRQNLPEDQCIFIRGFRVARVLDILPKQLKGAAGPNSRPGGDHDGDEPDKELESIPAFTKVKSSY